MARWTFALIIGFLGALGVPAAAHAASRHPGAPVALTAAPDCLTPTRTAEPQTIVGEWNCAALVEVRLSRPLRNGPPMVARALAIAHTCMYDAWSAYDTIAVATTASGRTLKTRVRHHTDANKAKAISFAAYRCLLNLYPDDGNYNAPQPPLAATPSARLAAVLGRLGYDPADPSVADPATPAGVGYAAAQAVIDARANDGSNQYGTLPAPPCVTDVFPWTATPLKHRGDAPPEVQPLPCTAPAGFPAYGDYVAHGYSPYVPSNPLMGFCSPLLALCPAADDFVDPLLPWPNVVDPNHWQPLVYSSHARQTFVAPHWERVTPFALRSADQFDHTLIPPPDVFKNRGHYFKNVNEIIKYSRELDEARKLIVEYWADGPDSECPPGHWGLFAQFVSRRDHHTIDQDVKMFFAMHNASFDAGIVAWHIKRKYDGVRPITAIRYTKQGQTIRAWGGPGQPTENIRGEQWTPYNPGTNLTPPFPGYFSGHSVFSRSSATVLQLFTGSDAFGYSAVIPAGFGRVEPNIPAVDTTVSFATFDDAAEQAGLSRLYGGIHFSDDNRTGQAVGLEIGRQAWEKAQRYFNGTARTPWR
jgi:hypothetical protein